MEDNISTNGAAKRLTREAFRLRPRSIAKLDESDISVDEAPANLIHNTLPDELNACCATERLKQPEVEAFTYTYPDMLGEPTKHFKIRILDDAFQAAKPDKKDRRPKCPQPRNSGSRVYFPRNPLAGKTWVDIAEDPTISIAITEGEAKAICATKNGIPTVSIGGVACVGALLEDCKSFVWKGRTVAIVFDREAVNADAKNAVVNLWAAELARKIAELGATPLKVDLPDAYNNQKKTGIDDAIVVLGVDAVRKCINDAPEFEENATLRRLNIEWTYVRKQKRVYNQPLDEFFTRKEFEDDTAATAKYSKLVFDGKGKPKMTEAHGVRNGSSGHSSGVSIASDGK